MSNELAVLENLNAIELYVAGGTDKILQDIREQSLDVIPDVSTAKGRKEIQNRSGKVSKSKVILLKLGNALKDELKAQLKPITLETTKVTNILDALRKEVREPLTIWEGEEVARVDELKARLNALEFSLEYYNGFTISDLSSHLEQSKDITLNSDTFGEFLAEAEIAHPIFIEKLTDHLNELKIKESDRLKLIQLEKDEADRQQKEREEKIARDAAAAAEAETKAIAAKAKEDAKKAKTEKKEALEREEAAKKKAIQDAIVAEAKVEWDKKEAAKNAQIAKEKAAQDVKDAETRAKARELEAREKAEADKKQAIEEERRKIARQKELDEFDAAEKKEAAEKAAAKKAANRAHQKKINRAAMADFAKIGINEATARKVIEAIARKQISFITINY